MKNTSKGSNALIQHKRGHRTKWTHTFHTIRRSPDKVAPQGKKLIDYTSTVLPHGSIISQDKFCENFVKLKSGQVDFSLKKTIILSAFEIHKPLAVKAIYLGMSNKKAFRILLPKS